MTIKPISVEWIELLNMLSFTNKDRREIMGKYKDNEKAFMYKCIYTPAIFKFIY